LGVKFFEHKAGQKNKKDVATIVKAKDIFFTKVSLKQQPLNGTSLNNLNLMVAGTGLVINAFAV
jgi:hypothetical protein